MYLHGSEASTSFLMLEWIELETPATTEIEGTTLLPTYSLAELRTPESSNT